MLLLPTSCGDMLFLVCVDLSFGVTRGSPLSVACEAAAAAACWQALLWLICALPNAIFYV